jgi:asparagine synthetase B (glutamine-hydrolysing)
MQALARELGIEPISFAPEDLAGATLEAMTADARPLPLISSLWHVHLGRAARARGVEVLLTGTGGDDLLDGDLAFFDPFLSPLGLRRALAGAWRLRGLYFATDTRWRFEKMIARPLLRGVVPEWLRQRVRRARKSDAPFDWAGPVLLEHRRCLASDTAPPEMLTTGTRFERLALGRYHLDYVDARTQSEIAADLPAVDPFFDPDVIELLATLPPECFFLGGWIRGLLREAMRGLVPEAILRREEKSSFEPAFAAFFHALGGAEALWPLLQMRGLASLGLVEPSRFQARFQDFLRHPLRPGPWLELWPAIATEAFVQKWSGPASRVGPS